MSERLELVEAGWTEDELKVYDALVSGQTAQGGPLNTSLPPRDNAVHRKAIRADRLARLILNPPTVNHGNPIRVRLSGYHIEGWLDLGCGDLSPFLMTDCHFDMTPNLNDARASFVGFRDCSMPGLMADRLICSGAVWLDGSNFADSVTFEDADVLDLALPNVTARAKTGDFTLNFSSTRVGRDLDLTGSQITGRITAGGIRVGDQVILSNVRISETEHKAAGVNLSLSSIGGQLLMSPGFACDGPVAIQGSIVRGQVDFNGATIKAPKGLAINGDHSNFALGLFIRGAEINGAVSIHHATIGCQLSLSGTTIAGCEGQGLRADHVVVDGAVFLSQGFNTDGSIDLHGAQVECHVFAKGMKVAALEQGRAVSFAGIEVKGNIQASDMQIAGRVSFMNARVAGHLDLSDSIIDADKTDVGLLISNSFITGELIARRIRMKSRLIGEHCTVHASIDFTEAEIGAYTSSRAIRMSGAEVQGDLTLTRSTVEGTVDLDRSEVGGDVRLTDAQVTGSPDQATSRGRSADSPHSERWRGTSVTMVAAQVGGDLDCRSATFSETLVVSDSRISKAIMLNQTTVSALERALIAKRLTAEHLDLRLKATPVGHVDLQFANLGRLTDNQNSWPSAGSSIDGLTYSRLTESGSRSDRLSWLRAATPSFSPQPYAQLAKHYVSIGQIELAREVRLEALRRTSKNAGPLGRAWGAVQNIILGYGYAPSRALYWILALLLAGTTFFIFQGGSCTYGGTINDGLCPASDNHPRWSPFLYTLDLLLPIAALGHDNMWRPTGLALAVSIFLTLAGWILITTAIAALARVLRRA